jgi:hypothetical protein
VRSRHRIVRAASSKNDIASLSVVAVQSLVATAADRPYNHITGTVSGCDERRPDTALAHVPHAGHRRRIAWIDTKRGKVIAVHAVSDVCALFSSITCRCIDDEAVGKMQ